MESIHVYAMKKKKRFCVVLYDLNLSTPFKVSTLFDNSQSENEK